MSSNSNLISNLLKFKKTKITQFRKLAKFKNLIILSKSQNVNINIEMIKFLTSKIKQFLPN